MNLEFQISPQIRAWGAANGYDVEMHYEAFVDYLANRTKKPYKNLDAAFRNCVRSDWFGLRKQKQIASRSSAWGNQGAPTETKRRPNDPLWIPGKDGDVGRWVMAND